MAANPITHTLEDVDSSQSAVCVWWRKPEYQNKNPETQGDSTDAGWRRSVKQTQSTMSSIHTSDNILVTYLHIV